MLENGGYVKVLNVKGVVDKYFCKDMDNLGKYVS